MLGTEDPTTLQLHQTTTPSPFLGTNQHDAGQARQPAFLTIPGMPDHPGIDLMRAYTLRTNPNIKYDLLGPEETSSIWLPPTVYPPHWDQERIVFNVIVKAAKDQCNTVQYSFLVVPTKPLSSIKNALLFGKVL